MDQRFEPKTNLGKKIINLLLLWIARSNPNILSPHSPHVDIQEQKTRLTGHRHRKLETADLGEGDCSRIPPLLRRRRRGEGGVRPLWRRDGDRPRAPGAGRGGGGRRRSARGGGMGRRRGGGRPRGRAGWGWGLGRRRRGRQRRPWGEALCGCAPREGKAGRGGEASREGGEVERGGAESRGRGGGGGRHEGNGRKMEEGLVGFLRGFWFGSDSESRTELCLPLGLCCCCLRWFGCSGLFGRNLFLSVCFNFLQGGFSSGCLAGLHTTKSLCYERA